MWAITSYYNPIGYKKRFENYKIFKKNLNIPLITVELSYNGKFELVHSDADILIQVSNGAMIWQKERLINLALKYLPKEVENVAWIDCDVLFEKSDWHLVAENQLKDNKIIQLFSEADGGNRFSYLASNGPRIVTSGIQKMKNNSWKVDVIFPKPLSMGSHKYSVTTSPQIAVNTENLSEDGNNYYDYGAGGDFRLRVNKLDSRWVYDPNNGTDGSWYIPGDMIDVEPTDFIGFTVHLMNDPSENERPDIMWVVSTLGAQINA